MKQFYLFFLLELIFILLFFILELMLHFSKFYTSFHNKYYDALLLSNVHYYIFYSTKNPSILLHFTYTLEYPKTTKIKKKELYL